MAIRQGNLSIYKNDKTNYRNITKIGGDLILFPGAKTELSSIETIGGRVQLVLSLLSE